MIGDDRPVTRAEYYSRWRRVTRRTGAPVRAACAGSPEAARDATNKRIANDRMKAGWSSTLDYPDITTGLRQPQSASGPG